MFLNTGIFLFLDKVILKIPTDFSKIWNFVDKLNNKSWLLYILKNFEQFQNLNNFRANFVLSKIP